MPQNLSRIVEPSFTTEEQAKIIPFDRAKLHAQANVKTSFLAGFVPRRLPERGSTAYIVGACRYLNHKAP